MVREEVALIVGHELIWREALEQSVHPQKLMSREELLEISEDVVNHIFDAAHLRALMTGTLASILLCSSVSSHKEQRWWNTKVICIKVR